MWIFCCGPLRSGSTLQFNIVREIVETTKLGFAVDYTFPEEFPEIYAKFQNEKKIKVFKTHQLTQLMIDLVNNDKAKCVYCFRDIRDVIVSLEHKGKRVIYKKSDYSEFTINYLKYYYQITMLPNCFISKYEIFYNNIKRECIEISKFLNIIISDKIAESISEILSYENGKKYISEVKKEEFVGKNGKVYNIDKKTLLHDNHFKHIHPGSYKIYLSKYNIYSIEKHAYKWLKENGYKVSFLNRIKFDLLKFLK